MHNDITLMFNHIVRQGSDRMYGCYIMETVADHIYVVNYYILLFMYLFLFCHWQLYPVRQCYECVPGQAEQCKLDHPIILCIGIYLLKSFMLHTR